MSKLRLIAAALAVAAVAITTPALAADAKQRIDLKVLVVDDGGTGVDTIVAQLERETIPYNRIDASAPISPADLADTVNGVRRAKYQGVVVPNENVAAATTLADFEREFGIRRLVAYTWANPAVGLTMTWSGALDGQNLTVTDAAKAAGFGYLAGTVAVDDRDPGVTESYGYLGTPATGFTPLVTANGQPLIGAYAHDGREELVVTLAMNRFQTHAMVLGHGIVQWLTKGVHLGHWRNWFSVHIDDVFLPDDRWHSGANCTVGDNCNVARDPGTYPYNTTIRMTLGDVTKLVDWQQDNGIKLDVAFNAGGAVDAGASDSLTTSLLTNKGKLRWLNHTFEHPYLGCVQNFAVVPWQCATDANGVVWVSQAEITAQIKDNVTWARGKGISLDATELVTGEHSGLRSLPQMPNDNPNLAPALAAAGVKVIASDASREPTSRMIGPAVTERRWPMNIFYNVATFAEEVDEYNWIYTSRADGGSGICEDNPATSTCIAPLSTKDGFATYIVPVETRIAFDHIVSTDPAPHYAHQSNLAENRILYPVLEEILKRYRTTFTAATPVLNPRFAEVAQQHQRQAAWRANADKVEAYTYDGRVWVFNGSGRTLEVPITVPAGTRTVTLSLLGELVGGLYGEAYGTERSAWKSLPSTGKQLLKLPS